MAQILEDLTHKTKGHPLRGQLGSRCKYICISIFTLPETNSLPLKWMVGMLVFFWAWPIFRCELSVSGSIT